MRQVIFAASLVVAMFAITVSMAATAGAWHANHLPQCEVGIEAALTALQTAAVSRQIKQHLDRLHFRQTRVLLAKKPLFFIGRVRRGESDLGNPASFRAGAQVETGGWYRGREIVYALLTDKARLKSALRVAERSTVPIPP